MHYLGHFAQKDSELDKKARKVEAFEKWKLIALSNLKEKSAAREAERLMHLKEANRKKSAYYNSLAVLTDKKSEMGEKMLKQEFFQTWLMVVELNQQARAFEEKTKELEEKEKKFKQAEEEKFRKMREKEMSNMRDLQGKVDALRQKELQAQREFELESERLELEAERLNDEREHERMLREMAERKHKALADAEWTYQTLTVVRPAPVNIRSDGPNDYLIGKRGGQAGKKMIEDDRHFRLLERSTT